MIQTCFGRGHFFFSEGEITTPRGGLFPKEIGLPLGRLQTIFYKAGIQLQD